MAKYQKIEVSVVGEEKIRDFHCTHVVVTTKMDIPGASERLGDGATQLDMWLTKDIPGYDLIAKYMKANPKMMNIDVESSKIEQYGFPIKQVSREEGMGDMVNELISVENVDIPKDKFEIPKGYTEKEETMPGFNFGDI